MAHTPDINAMAQQEETQRLETEGEYARLREVNADLLAALKECADRLEANRDEWGSVRHKTEVAQARAAIEKAEGN